MSEDPRLSAYLDDELGAAARAEVEAALATSSERRAELAAVTEARAALRRAPVPEAPAGFWASVEAAVASDAAPSDAVPSDAPAGVVAMARPGRGRAVAWIAGVAAAAVLAVVVVLPGPSRTEPPVRELVDAHAARASFAEEPVSQLAPVGTPVRFEP